VEGIERQEIALDEFAKNTLASFGFVRGFGLQNEANPAQAGVEKLPERSQKRTQLAMLSRPCQTLRVGEQAKRATTEILRLRSG
jgi:hypothetical protein